MAEIIDRKNGKITWNLRVGEKGEATVWTLDDPEKISRVLEAGEGALPTSGGFTRLRVTDGHLLLPVTLGGPLKIPLETLKPAMLKALKHKSKRALEEEEQEAEKKQKLEPLQWNGFTLVIDEIEDMIRFYKVPNEEITPKLLQLIMDWDDISEEGLDLYNETTDAWENKGYEVDERYRLLEGARVLYWQSYH